MNIASDLIWYIFGYPKDMYIAPRPSFDHIPAKYQTKAGENPFNVVWRNGIFDFQAWSACTEQFEYNDNLPLGNMWLCIFLCSLYFITIRLIQMFMKNRKPIKSKLIHQFTIFHNFGLHALSLVMFVQIVRYVYAAWVEYGTIFLFTDPGRVYQRGPYYFWVYIFYLSKFYEFIDTLLLAIGKKKIIFLHIYHHWATAILVNICMGGYQTTQFIAIIFNCFVHILMYLYYGLASMGLQPGRIWQMTMTSVQITQFIVGCTLTNGWAYYYFKGYPTSTWHFSHWFGQIILWSYLLLFIRLYQEKYGPVGLSKSFIREISKKSNTQIRFAHLSDFSNPTVLAKIINFNRPNTIKIDSEILSNPIEAFESLFETLKQLGFEKSRLPSPQKLARSQLEDASIAKFILSLKKFFSKKMK